MRNGRTGCRIRRITAVAKLQGARGGTIKSDRTALGLRARRATQRSAALMRRVHRRAGAIGRIFQRHAATLRCSRLTTRCAQRPLKIHRRANCGGIRRGADGAEGDGASTQVRFAITTPVKTAIAQIVGHQNFAATTERRQNTLANCRALVADHSTASNARAALSKANTLCSPL